MTTILPADGAIDPATRKPLWMLVPGTLMPAPGTTIVKVNLADLGPLLVERNVIR